MGEETPTPDELTGRFMHAFNVRDREALRALLPLELEDVRPGGETLRTADEVMAQYQRGWALMSYRAASAHPPAH